MDRRFLVAVNAVAHAKPTTRKPRRGELHQVLATLKTALDGTAVTGPGNKFRRKVLDDTIQHFTKNRTRMRYRRLRKQGLVISSGLIEGTCAIWSACASTAPGCDGARPEPKRSCTFGASCSTVCGWTSNRTSRVATRSGSLRSRF